MDKFFAFFGKAVLIITLLGGISYAAYTLGKSTSSTLKSGAASTTAMPTPTLDPGLMPEKIPEGAKKTIITAGLGKDSGLSFTKYQITVPEGWIPNHITTSEGTWVDTLTLTKGATQLKIFQAATGGAMCLYTGDADFEGPSSRYDSFVAITTADGIVLRRGSTNETSADYISKKGFTMCQKGSESYGQPTVFGHMSLTTAINPDAALLSEVDAIISSLKKLP
ncbi:MAG: hypothetical protein AAB542_03155 [Patescibacteria group bacterium]